MLITKQNPIRAAPATNFRYFSDRLLDMSNNFTSHFSADDAALVLIDFQPQMFMGVESHDRNAIKNNLQIIAKSAKLFNVPTVLSTVTPETFSGPFVPEITEGVFPGH
ncbi:MAG TPA: hypothetical protein VLN57_19830, partial [Xanthobacteraceae bacterium]|nr:hypothetical protein [Xanthobacteraceae bacterium]